MGQLGGQLAYLASYLKYPSDPGVALEPGRGGHGCPNMGARLSWACWACWAELYMGKVDAHKIRVGYCSPGTGRHTNCACYRVRFPTVALASPGGGGMAPWVTQRCATNSAGRNKMSQLRGQLWFGPFFV